MAPNNTSVWQLPYYLNGIDLVGDEASDAVVAETVYRVDGSHQEVDEHGHAPKEKGWAVKAAQERIGKMYYRTLDARLGSHLCFLDLSVEHVSRTSCSPAANENLHVISL